MSAHLTWSHLTTGYQLSACAPFALLLGAIAILPLVPKTHHWWERNTSKLLVAAILGLIGAGMYFSRTSDTHALLDALLEYAAFVGILAALYTAAAGIHITGAFAGFPRTNTLLLAGGMLLASLIGTTGASMLLIRPLLRANADRQHKTHVFVFFIFIVSNCGGLLSPMGDPPLFLGFLRGIPFFWCAQELWLDWLLVNGSLLGLFYIVDSLVFRRENAATRDRLRVAVAEVAARLHVRGWSHVGFLLAVPATMILYGMVLEPQLATLWGPHKGTLTAKIIQIALFFALAAAARRSMPAFLKHDIGFSWGPVLEVAALFIGIFLAMLPAVATLQAHAHHLPLDHPWQYLWSTGGFSAVLDNAPTYAAFGELASSRQQAGGLGNLAGAAPDILAAISCGAVFFGAMTYIGNGPNFMVKSICEAHAVKMPSFLGYLLWSVPILGTLLLVLTLVKFR